MKKEYAQIFVTNLPSFYKLRLYSQIAKFQKILVVFTHTAEATRNADFYKGEKNFDYVFLNGKNTFFKAFEFLKLLKSVKYKMLVLGGWDSPLYWLAVMLCPKKKNAVAVESSHFESKTNGVTGFIKRIFVFRCSTAYVSGINQSRLLQALHFKGKIIETKGVGLYNMVPQPPYSPKKEVKNFVYVGRLIACKNVGMLLEAFKKFPNLNLTVVGFGKDEKALKAKASPNVIFTGAIDNDKLPEIYRKNDVFVLPSLAEPWGLVVEEALNNGIACITSSVVGCNDSVLRDGENGVVFESGNLQALEDAIRKICDIDFYNSLILNISRQNPKEIEDWQINSYKL